MLRELPFLNSRLVRIFNLFMEIILIVTSAVIITLITYYVITRYLLGLNFNGFEEIAILIIVWMYFIGSANASREQSHISADMLDLFIKKFKVKKGLQLFYRFVGMGVLCFMIYLSIDFMSFNAERHVATIIFKWPMYIYHFSMVLGFCLMLFYDICHTVNAILEYKKVLRGEITRETIAVGEITGGPIAVGTIAGETIVETIPAGEIPAGTTTGDTKADTETDTQGGNGA